MDLPMPREAPVTSAIRLSRETKCHAPEIPEFLDFRATPDGYSLRRAKIRRGKQNLRLYPGRGHGGDQQERWNAVELRALGTAAGAVVSRPAPKKQGRSDAAPSGKPVGRKSVAGDGFGFHLGSRSDLYRLRGVGLGEVGRRGLGDVVERSDLNDGRLRLLEHQFLVDGANLGLFFVGLLAAGALFLGGG